LTLSPKNRKYPEGRKIPKRGVKLPISALLIFASFFGYGFYN
jgi:hypothetical protein